MNKAVAIALFALGLFGLALFVTAVQMARAHIEKSTADTVDAVRDSQNGAPPRYLDWPGNAEK